MSSKLSLYNLKCTIYPGKRNNLYVIVTKHKIFCLHKLWMMMIHMEVLVLEKFSSSKAWILWECLLSEHLLENVVYPSITYKFVVAYDNNICIYFCCQTLNCIRCIYKDHL